MPFSHQHHFFQDNLLLCFLILRVLKEKPFSVDDPSFQWTEEVSLASLPHQGHLCMLENHMLENRDGSTWSGEMDWWKTRVWAPRFSSSRGTRKSREDARIYSRKWEKIFYDWHPPMASSYGVQLITEISTAKVDFTFRVLCGFLILDDFLMSTSVVFTHPGWKWKNRETKESLGMRFLIHALMTCHPQPEQKLWWHRSLEVLSKWPQPPINGASKKM